MYSCRLCGVEDIVVDVKRGSFVFRRRQRWEGTPRRLGRRCRRAEGTVCHELEGLCVEGIYACERESEEANRRNGEGMTACAAEGSWRR